MSGKWAYMGAMLFNCNWLAFSLHFVAALGFVFSLHVWMQSLNSSKLCLFYLFTRQRHSSCKCSSFAQGNEKKRLTWLQSYNVCHSAGKSLSLFPELQLELSMGVSVQRGVPLTISNMNYCCCCGWSISVSGQLSSRLLTPSSAFSRLWVNFVTFYLTEKIML